MRIKGTSLLLIVALSAGASGCGYNKLQELDEQVNRSQGDIQAQLQRRTDLIGNLVNTVKGVAAQETTVFIAE